MQSHTASRWQRRMPANTVELKQSTLPGALNGSEVPGKFQYGFSVVTGSRIGRESAVPHVFIFWVLTWGRLNMWFDFLTKQLGFLFCYSFSLTLIDALDTLLVSVSHLFLFLAA